MHALAEKCGISEILEQALAGSQIRTALVIGRENFWLLLKDFTYDPGDGNHDSNSKYSNQPFRAATHLQICREYFGLMQNYVVWDRFM